MIKVKSEVDLIKESLNAIIDRNISKAKTGNLTENDIFNLTDCFKHLKKETNHINWMNHKLRDSNISTNITLWLKKF